MSRLDHECHQNKFASFSIYAEPQDGIVENMADFKNVNVVANPVIQNLS